MSTNDGNYLIDKLLGWLIGSAFPSAPATIYAALWHGDPDSGGTEVTQSNSLTRQSTSLGSVSSHALTSNTTLNFGTVTGSPANTVTYVTLHDSSTAGNLLAKVAITAITLATGNVVEILSGSLVVAVATEDFGLTQIATVTGFNKPAVTLLVNSGKTTQASPTFQAGQSVPVGALIFGVCIGSVDDITQVSDSRNASAYPLIRHASKNPFIFFYYLSSLAMISTDTFLISQASGATEIIVGYATNVKTASAIDLSSNTATSTGTSVTDSAGHTSASPNEVILAVSDVVLVRTDHLPLNRSNYHGYKYFELLR